VHPDSSHLGFLDVFETVKCDNQELQGSLLIHLSMNLMNFEKIDAKEG
jgi:hypothetical protein